MPVLEDTEISTSVTGHIASETNDETNCERCTSNDSRAALKLTLYTAMIALILGIAYCFYLYVTATDTMILSR